MGQPNILVDHRGHACLTDFGFASVARGLNSVLVTKVQGFTPWWAAPEIIKSGDRNTQEADVFAFGMVVIEVSPWTSLHHVEGWMVHLTSKSYPRSSQGGIHSASSQPQLLFQRPWEVNDPVVPKYQV